MDLLHEQTKLAFGFLHDLIQAVEKEVGKLSKVVASITSLLVIGFAYWSRGRLSVVMTDSFYLLGTMPLSLENVPC